MTFWIRFSPIFGYSWGYPSIDCVAATSETYFSHFWWLHLRSGWTWSGSGEASLCGLWMVTFLLGPHMGRVESDLYSYKDTGPITRVPTPWPHLNSVIPQRLCLEIASLWVVGLCVGDMIQSTEIDFCALLWNAFKKIDWYLSDLWQNVNCGMKAEDVWAFTEQFFQLFSMFKNVREKKKPALSL